MTLRLLKKGVKDNSWLFFLVLLLASLFTGLWEMLEDIRTQHFFVVRDSTGKEKLLTAHFSSLPFCRWWVIFSSWKNRKWKDKIKANKRAEKTSTTHRAKAQTVSFLPLLSGRDDTKKFFFRFRRLWLHDFFLHLFFCLESRKEKQSLGEKHKSFLSATAKEEGHTEDLALIGHPLTVSLFLAIMRSSEGRFSLK